MTGQVGATQANERDGEQSRYAPREVMARHSADGSMVLTACVAPPEVEGNIVDYLERWAFERPDRIFLAQRAEDRSWESVTYGDAWRRVQAIAQGLIDLGLQPGRAVMILSPASIEHALVMLAAMLIGAPAVPTSPAYSLLPEARPRLKEIVALIEPAIVFAQSEGPFREALDETGLAETPLLTVKGGELSGSLAQFYGLLPTGEVARRRATVSGDTIGKILFTSGSTGSPKGVINTQTMLCHAVCSTCGLVPDSPDGPIFVDWMPWHHTMGGNAVLHGTLRTGGTFYIDDGRPLPGMFAKTLENLRDGRPTMFQSVPAAYGLLVDALERDEALCIAFFSRLERMLYAGASLPSDIWGRMQALAVRTRGTQVDFGSALGTTETGPGITVTHWASNGQGEIGLPVAGAEVKLLPVEEKFEIRVRGPMVTPGYYGRPDLTDAAFDAEGFYKTGDLVELVDRANLALGLRFAGRLSENFKLANGSWVATGELRLAVINACQPLMGDIVLAGVDRDDVRALVWPSPGVDVSDADAVAACTAAIADRLTAYNARHHGPTHRIAAFRVMTDPPSMGAGEITDKGYINQRGVLSTRAAEVEKLYAADAIPGTHRL